MKKTLVFIVIVLLAAAASWADEPAAGGARNFKNRQGMSFVLIPAGSYMMGSPPGEREGDRRERYHRATITMPFYLQTTEVTQEQWEAVMGYNPSFFKDCGGSCPVEQVSWQEVQEFIRRLNRLENSDKYRLPTEAEWEYAARAGTTTVFNTGPCLLTDQANYNGDFPLAGCPRGEYRARPMPAASFPPNQWGLYDMHGNVSEWVQDGNGSYPAGEATDYRGADQGSTRVFRGGDWSHDAWSCRSAGRFAGHPAGGDNYLGLRLLRTP
ncbi:MAG: formylglycine-generating enzyme family protein [Syntrophobacterales bacterium]|jgi:formylglycine-generating enzyme required for sulfatase activity|nr:formylglycine-generating enzyme family protein [Syntrophobacterales bacterium]